MYVFNIAEKINHFRVPLTHGREVYLDAVTGAMVLNMIFS